jgi:hypothetical protein
MSEENGYPKAQFSMFLLPSKDGQLVLRGDTPEEVLLQLQTLTNTDGGPSMISDFMDQMALLRAAGVVAGAATEPTRSQYGTQTVEPADAISYPVKTCQACPNHPAMTRSTGVSNKTGKPWVRHTCPQNREHITWGD